MECLPCKKKFTESENYDKHLQSQEHKQKILNEQERQNDETQPDESKEVSSNLLIMECLPCEEKFTESENYGKHLQSHEHKQKILNVQERQNDETKPKESKEVSSNLLIMQCLPCEEKFTESENYDKHLQSQEHKQKILYIQQASEVSSNLNYPGTIKCQICDLSFNSLESYQNHSVTQEHALKIILKECSLSLNLDTIMTLHNSELNAMKDKTEITNEDTTSCELNKTSDLLYGKCEICAKIFSGPEPYKQHLESQAHKKKVALKQNSTYAGGSIFKCEPCNKIFTGQVPHIQHMASETHRKKLEKIEAIENFRRVHSSNSEMGIKENTVEKEDSNKPFFCKICNKECSGLIPYEQHLRGSIHSKNAKRAESQNSTKESLSQPQLSKLSDGSENFETDKKDTEKGSAFVQQIEVLSVEEVEKMFKIFGPDDKIVF